MHLFFVVLIKPPVIFYLSVEVVSVISALDLLVVSFKFYTTNHSSKLAATTQPHCPLIGSFTLHARCRVSPQVMSHTREIPL